MREGGAGDGRTKLRLAPRTLRNVAWSAAIVCALIAGWAPRRSTRGPTTRIVVADVSASTGEAAPTSSMAGAREGLRAGDRLGLVAFGERSRVVLPPGDPERERTPAAVRVGPHASDLAAALDLTARMADAERAIGRSVEVLLFTDGWSTSRAADETRAALALAAAGCTSFVVESVPTQAPPAVVRRLAGPGRVARGEPFSLEVQGTAPEGGAVVELLRADALEDTRTVVAAGPFRVQFVRVEDVPGPVTYGARVAGEEFVPAAGSTVVVADAGARIVFGAEAPALLDEEMLADSRRVGRAAMRGLDEALPGLGGVVALDVSDDWLSEDVVTALERFVGRGGRVLLVGGPHAFGAGRWAGRPVERISPLLSRPPESDGLLLYVGLDGSGSMARPWGGASGTVSQDSVVRDAARALVRSAAADTTLVLRRFAGALAPAGAAAGRFRLDAEGRVGALAALDALSQPGGSTALLPPLEEATRVMASAEGGPRQVLLLTDGRIADEPPAVHAVLNGLVERGVGVTLAIPGGASPGERLTRAVEGTGARIARAERPEDLAALFRAVEGQARQREPIVENRRLRPTDTGTALLPGLAAWPEARRIDRTWPAPDASVLVETSRGEPVVAVRSIGAGRVAAIATLPGRDDWLGDTPAARRLVRALSRLVERPAAAGLRVEREGEFLLVRWSEALPGGVRPAHASWEAADGTERRVLLEEGPRGLLRAPLTEADSGATAVVRILSADGRELGASGLDRPVPAEYGGARRADLEALARLAEAPRDTRGASLRPWLAALAVLLALGGCAARWDGRLPSSVPHRS